MARKVFVKVLSETDTTGAVRPVSITWEDGRVYPIDRVTDVRRAASMKAGGMGMRYTCIIRNRTVFLFFEEPRWFLEAKDAQGAG